MVATLDEIALRYLNDKHIAIETITAQQLSDAKAYSACYTWYIEKQLVLPNTADLAASIFVQKYALHDSEGTCLENTPEMMWDRIANVLAGEELATNPTSEKTRQQWFDIFRCALENWKYTPQGSGLYSLGNPFVKASASNCFVISSPTDSLESIFDTARNMSKIFAARGGVGVDISNLRPYGSVTNNAAKTSTGAASFMDFYSHVTSTIGQCIEENQIVLTKRGNIAIKDVMAGDLVWTKRGWIGNLETINNGIKPVYRLTTKRGYEILATNNHVFVGTNQDGFDLNEIQLGDFSIGDTIVMMPGTPTNDIQYVKLNTSVSYNQGHGAVAGGNGLNEAITLPDELTEDLAYFLGYSFGDGYVELDKFNEPVRFDLACSTKHPKIENKLVSIGNVLFGYLPKVTAGDGNVNNVTIYSKKLGLYLAQNGLLKQKAGILEMPELVKQSKTSVQMAFISGYFDADGYASGAKKGYVIGSICMPMLKSIQQMLMSAGIVSHITTEKRNGLEETKNWQDLHSLSITGAYSQKLAVSLLSESVKISNKAFIAKRDNLLTPFNAKSYNIKYTFNYVPDNSQCLSAKAFSMLQEANEISDEILISDEVASVELVGDATVYDLRLESEHLYSCQGFNLHNSGRRGATMISIRVDHPDIFRFIQMKQDIDKQWFFNELTEAGVDINDPKYSAIVDRLKSTSHANVSVKLTDKFIHAVETDSEFELYFDFDNDKYSRISTMVKARDIWNKLIEGATKSAEPGMLNWDRITSESPADCYATETTYELDGKPVNYSFATISTNPSLRWDTKVLTDAGVFNIKSLADRSTINVKTAEGVFREAVAFKSGADKQLVKLTFSHGQSVFCTKEHKWPVLNTLGKLTNHYGKVIKKLSVDLKQQDKIYFPYDNQPINNTTCGFSKLDGFVLGWNQGDGWISEHKQNGTQYGFIFSSEDLNSSIGDTVLDYVNSFTKQPSSLTQDHDSSAYKFVTTDKVFASHFGLLGACNKSTGVPATVWTGNSEFIAGYLDGLFSADGYVEAKSGLPQCRIVLTSAHQLLLSDIQKLLAFYGIKSNIKTQTTAGNFPNEVSNAGKLYTRYDLYIGGMAAKKFAKTFTLSNSKKQAKLQLILSADPSSYANDREYLTIRSVELTDIYEDVYDITVADDTHTFIMECGLTGNCGELPLSAGDSCCLGTHNLPAFVINPYKDNAKFDWAEFERVVQISTRAQDNIKNIDIGLVPLEINRISAQLGRRIGLGCNGLSDCLAMLGLRYDTGEAITMAERIYTVLRDTVYATSIQLATEKGAFPIYDAEKEIDNPFLKRLPKELQGKPRRNIACLTNAPNGSMAIEMNGSSSGIEPVFETAEYTRNVKKPGTNDFVQYKVQHQAISDCILAGGNPNIFVKANDIDGMMRIKLQSTLQKYIDHAISVTTNLPAGTTQEHVGNLYLQAFKSGCKGFTVYVDGCRTGVLNSIKEVSKVHKTVERPKTTNIDIHKVKYKDKPWCVLVGRADNGPIEVFAGIEEDTPLPNKYYKAELSKKSRGHYSLTIYLSEDAESDVIKIGNIGARFPLPEGMALTRLISMSLRNGVPILEICEQLTKSSNSMFDYPAVLNRVLKQYIPEEDVLSKEKAKGERCPECGSDLIIKRESGCILKQCSSCSYVDSKCN